MTSKTSFMKYFLIAFTLMFISSGLNAGTFGSDGKKKDKEKKKSYRLTGRMCFISLMVKRVSSVLIRKGKLPTRLMLHYPKILLCMW